jgi:2-phosphosulfolactate phosphatase
MSRGTVVIDALPERASRYVADHAVVAIDVIRATTTAVTVVALGRRCFCVPSIPDALRVRRRLDEALLGGELEGRTPDGFDVGNSPTTFAARTDVHRPLVLLSSSGTRLLHAVRDAENVYLACFRNAAAVARHVVVRHRRIAVIGAGSRGQFRTEDQICCAWIAADLLDAGYEAADARTSAVVARWRGAQAAACASGTSADYLRRSDQVADLDFVLTHVNDLDIVFTLLADGEVVALPAEGSAATLRGKAALGA